MQEAIAAMDALSVAIQRSVDAAVANLVPEGRFALSVSWEEDRRGRMTLTVALDDGSTIIGRGPAKLEAIEDAERYVKLLPRVSRGERRTP